MLVFVGVVSAFAQQPAHAQHSDRTPPSAEQRAERMLTALTKSVEVSEAQQTEIAAIFKSFYEEQQELRGDWEKMRELATSRDEKVKAVLADDAQYEAYTEFLKEHRQKARRGGARKQGKGKH